MLVTHKDAADKIWRPKKFIQDAMSWYEQFYGTRNIIDECRQVPAPQPDEVAMKRQLIDSTIIHG